MDQSSTLCLKPNSAKMRGGCKGTFIATSRRLESLETSRFRRLEGSDLGGLTVFGMP